MLKPRLPPRTIRESLTWQRVRLIENVERELSLLRRQTSAPLRLWWAFAECCEQSREEIRAVGDASRVPPDASGAAGPDSSQGDYCGADGGDHDWVVGYWIGGERDENGEHTYCRKCHEEYAP